MDVSTNALRTTDRPDHQIDLLIAALQQLRAGFTPIPVNNKVSLVEWKQYQHSRPDLNTVVRWFTGTKPTGMALVTGAKTGLVCIDIDPGGRKTINALKLHLPTTVSEQTPRGWHLYFKHPGPEWEVRGLTSECIGLPGVDIRGDGNYSVCAPSEGYEWADNLSFAEMEPAEMPKWLWELKDRQGEPVMRQRRGAPRQAVAVAERNGGCPKRSAPRLF